MSDDQASKGKPAAAKSSLSKRLLILAGVSVIAVGGVLGFKQYLKSQIPKEDQNFAKKRAEGLPDADVEPTGMEVLKDVFSSSSPSKEVEELKGKKADEVVFTYDAIMKMTPQELEKNIKEVSGQLTAMRDSLPPSFGGTVPGPSKQPEGNGDADSDDKPKTATIQSLALPLTVMRQVAESRK